MTDEEMYKELEMFANDCTVARDINVKISSHNISFSPKEGLCGFKYEDAEYLSGLINGAKHYLFWKKRGGR